MARKKLEIGQSQFGFPDEELKTSLHDEIVLWLKRNAKEIAIKLLSWQSTWPPDLPAKLESQLKATIEERKCLLRDAIKQLGDEIQTMQTKSHMSHWVHTKCESLELKNRELISLEAWTGLGEPPLPEIEVTSEMEWPIQRQRYQAVDIVGYADLVCYVRFTALRCSPPPYNPNLRQPELGVDVETYTRWKIEWHRAGNFAFDAKGEIRSLGELIKQFKTYEVYSKMPFYVVSPDARFANEISDEGFGFIKYPDGLITPPKKRNSAC